MGGINTWVKIWPEIGVERGETPYMYLIIQKMQLCK